MVEHASNPERRRERRRRKKKKKKKKKKQLRCHPDVGKFKVIY
jgi:hypothetical protein